MLKMLQIIFERLGLKKPSTVASKIADIAELALPVVAAVAEATGTRQGQIIAGAATVASEIERRQAAAATMRVQHPELQSVPDRYVNAAIENAYVKYREDQANGTL